MSESIPETMTAIEIAAPGDADVLLPTMRPVPRPGPGELLVRVAAAGINRPDVLQRMGMYPPPPGAPDIPGLEVAGTVVATGDGGVGEWHVGDDVCALVAGGGYAEFALVPAPQALPVPEGCTPAEAAAVPETFFTVWTNIFMGLVMCFPSSTNHQTMLWPLYGCHPLVTSVGLGVPYHWTIYDQNFGLVLFQN